MMQPIRNIAILAHVDAGKTTLSERILFTAGEVRRPGNVEEGLATMDYLPEEKERGITIESGVAHFEWRGSWFNFIDTPGHVDFGAEVDMALSAVEGAVLIVSAADGVETQTLSAWKKLRDRGVRTIIFINKLDNPDFSLDDALIGVEEAFGARPVLLTFPEYRQGKMSAVLDVISGTRLSHSADGQEIPCPVAKNDSSAGSLQRCYNEAVDFASSFDDGVLEMAMAGTSVPPADLVRGLSALAASDDYVLCYAGSALENFGVRSLMTGLSFFLPSPPDFHGKYLGEVIRLRHFPEVGEISLFRSMADVPCRDWPADFAFFRMKANALDPVPEIRPGDIYAMRAPRKMELGMLLGLDGLDCERDASMMRLPPYSPLLQTQVECRAVEDYERVERSLDTLSRMDPSFKVVPHPEGGFWVLQTVGEVQLEVLLARLRREFNCDVRSGSPEVQWQERLLHRVGPFDNVFQSGPLKVSVSLSAEPLPDTEHDVRLKADFLEAAPREILAGVRSALLEAAETGILGKGALAGVRFEVHSLEYSENVPVAMIKKACADAVALLVKPQDIVLYEPYMELSLECPVEFAGKVTDDIQARGGRVREVNGDGRTHSLKAEVPLRRFFGYSTAVRSVSRGAAQYSLRFLDFRVHKM